MGIIVAEKVRFRSDPLTTAPRSEIRVPQSYDATLVLFSFHARKGESRTLCLSATQTHRRWECASPAVSTGPPSTSLDLVSA